jgi:hypothetical protein
MIRKQITATDVSTGTTRDCGTTATFFELLTGGRDAVIFEDEDDSSEWKRATQGIKRITPSIHAVLSGQI